MTLRYQRFPTQLGVFLSKMRQKNQRQNFPHAVGGLVQRKHLMKKEEFEMGAWDREKREYSRLSALYEEIPKNKRTVAEGLIVEASRLKVSLDECWEDIQKGGRYFVDVKTGTEKERPCSVLFKDLDRSYRQTLKHLDSLLPTEVEKKKSFSRLDDDDE
jgi:hypothetical protein